MNTATATPPPPTFPDPEPIPLPVRSQTRTNLSNEIIFSAMSGVLLGLIFHTSQVVALKALSASPAEITLLVIAFPIGAFLGPLWATLGQRWGMQRLVLAATLLSSLPLLAVAWIGDSLVFVLIASWSMLLHGAMKMGYSAMYRRVYPNLLRGRVIGRLLFWNTLTMVPTILLTGWLLDVNREVYRILYPIGGICGIVGCYFYARLRPIEVEVPVRSPLGLKASWEGVRKALVLDRAFLFFQIAFFLAGSAFFMTWHVTLMLTERTFDVSALELALWLSVVPQLLLTLSSPMWGKIVDRFGLAECRLGMTCCMVGYLCCYFTGISFGIFWLICLGGLIEGIARGGGHLTWALAATQYAPRAEDVPLYNGVHLVLNGIRGLLLPWVGLFCFVRFGSGTILLATLLTALGIPVLVHTIRIVRERTALSE